MTKEEKLDKKNAMDEINVPKQKRGAFMRFANRWGRFNIHEDWKWYEYSSLEWNKRSTLTMEEMWVIYQHQAVP